MANRTVGRIERRSEDDATGGERPLGQKGKHATGRAREPDGAVGGLHRPDRRRRSLRHVVKDGTGLFAKSASDASLRIDAGMEEPFAVRLHANRGLRTDVVTGRASATASGGGKLRTAAHANFLQNRVHCAAA